MPLNVSDKNLLMKAVKIFKDRPLMQIFTKEFDEIGKKICNNKYETLEDFKEDILELISLSNIEKHTTGTSENILCIRKYMNSFVLKVFDEIDEKKVRILVREFVKKL